jgi:hypothetical protein
MIETVLRCHATDRRQPINNPDEMPAGWVSIPVMNAGTNDGPVRELRDLHFASFEVMAEWANSQSVLNRTEHKRTAPPPTSRHGLRTA